MTAHHLKHPITYLFVLVMLLCGSGANCQRSMLVNPFAAPGPAAPQVLAEGSSRDQIIAAVNQNSSPHPIAQCHRRVDHDSRHAGPAAAERQHRGRAAGPISPDRGHGHHRPGARHGQQRRVVLDVGSPQPAAGRLHLPARSIRHSNIRQVMPVEPSWLLAALGMVDHRPGQRVRRPVATRRRHGGTENVAAVCSGNLNRVTVIDARRGWVVEQHVYDQAGTTLLASAVAESHRYYPVAASFAAAIGVRFNCRRRGSKFKIDLGSVQINQLAGDRGTTLDAADVRRLSAVRSGRRRPRHAVARRNYDAPTIRAAFCPPAIPRT